MPDSASDGAVDEAGFLASVDVTPDVQAMYDDDIGETGYVMNLTRVWAHSPDVHRAFWEFLRVATKAAGLDLRRRGVLVTATASTLGDPYCSLAWGRRLANATSPETAADVVAGGESGLADSDAALARWARKVAADGTATTRDDVRELRDAGFSDDEIFAVTAYIAGRIAFSTINDALGALPDVELGDLVPREVQAAVERRGRGRTSAP